MENINQLKILSSSLRRRSLEIAFSARKHGAHLGGGLSTIEIFAVLYGNILKYNTKNPLDEHRDRLIVSKGHCVLAYYAALEYAGFLSKEDIESFETNGSPFHGHATRNLNYGIEFSGGSLSLGMSFSIGVAIALKKKGLNNRVYTIVGDGECDEGLIWESVMAAANFKLDNFTLIIDANQLQYDGYTKDIMDTISLAEKFRSFGFHSLEIDGHDCQSIDDALRISVKEKPVAVIAHTIKGKGVSFMENKKEWHHGSLSQEQYEQALSELS